MEISAFLKEMARMVCQPSIFALRASSDEWLGLPAETRALRAESEGWVILTMRTIRISVSTAVKNCMEVWRDK